MKKHIFLILLVSGLTNSNAQSLFRDIRNFDNYSDAHKKRLKKYYFGYGKPYMSVDIQQHYYSPGVIDVNVDNKVDGSGSYSCTAGAFYPVMKTGLSSAIGFDIAVDGEVFAFNTPVINYGSEVTIQDNGICEIIGVPISLVYKSGGEVNLEKHNRVLFTIGFGLEPAVSASKIIVPDFTYFGRRYVMVEFGIFAGIAWKSRATYYAGNVFLVNQTNGTLDYVSSINNANQDGSIDVKAIASGCFNISLLIMPFSYKWSREYPQW